MKALHLTICLLMLTLTACQQNEPDQKKENVNNLHYIKDHDGSSTSEPLKEVSDSLPGQNANEDYTEKNEPPIKKPELIDESNFSGDELEIIKLMNKSILYLFEEDKESYTKLFYYQKLPGYPSYKIRKIILKNSINIQEQTEIFEAVVNAEQIKYGDNDPNNSMYVFRKDKTKSSKWKISDID